MSYETVSYEREGAIGILTLNRPKALNALNRQLLIELRHQLEEIERDSTLRALIVTGAGPKSFVAGADIAEMKDMGPEEAVKFVHIGQNVMRTFEKLTIPVIAAVNGFALGGGCELALSCDIVLASENAKFGQPEVNLGVIPGFGGTQRLARKVGPMMAKYLILSAEIISAQEALRIGLVARVYPQPELLDQAKALANQIASKGPLAVKEAKSVIDHGLDHTLDEGLELEARAFVRGFSHGEQKEGMTAFIEKRPARF